MDRAYLPLDADTAAVLARVPSARAQAHLLAQLVAVTGGIAAVATRCPRCREEDGLVIRLAALLRPAERPTEREEIRRVMVARPRAR